MFDLVARFLNGFITLVIFYRLYGFYRENEGRFYLYWSLGFLLYGLNIVLRLFITHIEMNLIGFLAFLLNLLGFILIIAGLGDLVDKTRIILSSILVIQFFLVFIVYLFDVQSIAWTMLLVPHLLIIISLGYLNIRYGLNVNLLATGWMPILFANAALALNLVDILYVDIISGLAKIIVYYGMTKPSFRQMADKLKKFMLTGMPTEYVESFSGGFYLVEPKTVDKSRDIDWIKARIKKNHARGIQTILFSFYDIIDEKNLIEAIRESLYLVRVVNDRRAVPHVFEDRVTTVNDDLTRIRLLLGDIIETSMETTIPSEVILYSLSNAILSYGFNQVYSVLLGMNPEVSGSNIRVMGFLFPSMHEDPSLVARFELLARKVIEV